MKRLVLYITCIGIGAIILLSIFRIGRIYIEDHNKSVFVNKITLVEGKYLMSDTLYLCDSDMKTCFSVLKNDSLSNLVEEDTCYHCQNTFREHHDKEYWNQILAFSLDFIDF